MEAVPIVDHTQKPARRQSAFVEVGLIDEEYVKNRLENPISAPAPPPPSSPRVRFVDDVEIIEAKAVSKPNSDDDSDFSDWDDSDASDDESETSRNLQITTRQRSPAQFYKLSMLLLLLAISVPLLQANPFLGEGTNILPGAKGGVIHRDPNPILDVEMDIQKRENTQTSVCKRWSHQSALVNGTLWLYGGRSTTADQQVDNTWNNDFLTLDLTKGWQTGSPPLKGLPRPDGPPKVSNGFLWNSRTSLYMYGGEYSDKPRAFPDAFSLWEYNILSSSWIEHRNPKTSAGAMAERDGQPVQRSAEGAGFNVASLGRGWYFGGHLDAYTTQGWDWSIPRIYLKSLVEYTFPGASNRAVDSLSDGKAAGPEGVWRNVTEGGLQDQPGFTERADGVLVYIPGFGKEGILLGLAGGTNTTFTQMNVIDVYDIATSTWYKQGTTGGLPSLRVNPCAVVAAAADGSSYNVYMFGGQNLQPAGDQTQKNDMWILSVPSFTWIQTDSKGAPYGRSGHTCNVWDGQMVVVGGYVGEDLTCDSPGVYIYNLSSLEWKTEFVSLSGRPNNNADAKAITDGDANPWSQQISQRGSSPESGLEGSYGYTVPDAVRKVIGGSPTGGATITAPVQVPSEGPLATGKPVTYTVTGPGGAIITSISPPGQSSNSGGSNVGVIVAGVLAGVFGLVAIYFGVCALIYRKRVQLYQKHTAMAQRAAADSARAEKAVLVPPPSAISSSDRHSGSIRDSREHSTSISGAAGSGARYSSAVSRKSSTASSTDELIAGQEPTFWGTRGVLLNPRRSLRVINRD